MTIVRLNRSRYSPKDPTGAKQHGGRWNSPGNAVLYASSTLALACLEVLVHIRDVGLMPTDYVFCEADMPEDLIVQWTFTGLAALAKIESPVLSREYGDGWFATPVKAVPSVIIPREMNYFISPVHPQFGELVWGEPQSFRFDPRLIAAAE